VPKLCEKTFSTYASVMTETVCFEQKNNIYNAKFWDLGANGDRG